MELVKVHQKILLPFVQEAIKALETMADLKGFVADAFPEDVEKFPFNGYAVAVVAKTFGSIEGKVLMHHYTETALAIGNRVRSKMLGESKEALEIDEEVGEAVTEFTNTIIGLATRKLSDSDLGIVFNPPIFIESDEDMDMIMADVTEILTIPIDVKNVGRFFITYLLHKQTE